MGGWRWARRGLVLCTAAALMACGGAGGPQEQAALADVHTAAAEQDAARAADDGLYAAGALAANGDARGAKVDIFAAGPLQGALAVWAQREGAQQSVWSSRHVPGVGWGSAQQVQSSGEADAAPEVAASGAGFGMAVWRQFDGTRQNLWASRYDLSTGLWGAPQQIEPGAGGDSSQHQLAMNRETGAAMVVWAKHSDTISTHRDVWAVRFDPSSGWLAPEQIETDSEANAGSPQVVVANEGSLRAVAVWRHGQHIWSNEFNGGQWGAAQPLETGAFVSGARAPHIAANNNLSEVVAVWERHDGTYNNLWASRYTLGGAWSPVQLIDAGSGNAFDPQVDMKPAASAGMVVWQQFDMQRASIWARSYEGNGTFGAAQLVEGRSVGNALNPKLAFTKAVTPNPKPMVVWEEEWALGDYRRHIWASEPLPNGSWSAPQLIMKHPQWPRSGNFAFEPDVAVDHNGSAVVVWSEQEGVRTDIRANRSEPNGTLGSQWGVPQLLTALNDLARGVAALMGGERPMSRFLAAD